MWVSKEVPIAWHGPCFQCYTRRLNCLMAEVGGCSEWCSAPCTLGLLWWTLWGHGKGGRICCTFLTGYPIHRAFMSICCRIMHDNVKAEDLSLSTRSFCKRLVHTPRIFKPTMRTKLGKLETWIGTPGFVSCALGTLWVGADYLLGSLWALAILNREWDIMAMKPQNLHPGLGCNSRDAAIQTSWMPMMVQAQSWHRA